MDPRPFVALAEDTMPTEEARISVLTSATTCTQDSYGKTTQSPSYMYEPLPKSSESGANNHQAHEIQSLKLQNSELVQKLDEKKKELVRANAIIESLQAATGSVPWSPIVSCRDCSAILTDKMTLQHMENPNLHQMFLIRACIEDVIRCVHNCYNQGENPTGGEGVLIAMLGPPVERDDVHVYNIPTKSIIETKSLVSDEKGVSEPMLLKLVYEEAKAAKFILCRTTFDEDSMLIEPVATAMALKWLVQMWPRWKIEHGLHTLIVCIPYGGKYNAEVAIAVNEAHSSGIIIVCAAGWRETGIAFPAKFGSVICVGSEQCDGTVASYSPRGRELDIVGPGSVRFERNYIIGPAVSAAFVAGKLASMCTEAFDTSVIKKLFESTSQHSVETGFGRLDTSLFTAWPKEQSVILNQTRKVVASEKFLNDAQLNTNHWSSNAIKHKKHFQATGTTIAIIDKFADNFLTHLKTHQVKVNYHSINKVVVEYFYLPSADMVNERCCVRYHKTLKSHALQCAAIIANTAPKCRLLMIRVTDPVDAEKVDLALDLVTEKKPDIVLLSSFIDSKYMNNICNHLHLRIVICAAGDEGKTDVNTIHYPVHFGDVITIGACNRAGERCSYSSVGRQVDFLCPGQFSVADPSGTGYTCYAAAAAAAYIALLLEYIDNTIKKLHHSPKDRQYMQGCVRNTHFMRALLSSNTLNFCHGKEHNSTDGYGMLLTGALFYLEPATIMQEIITFHSDTPLKLPSS